MITNPCFEVELPEVPVPMFMNKFRVGDLCHDVDPLYSMGFTIAVLLKPSPTYKGSFSHKAKRWTIENPAVDHLKTVLIENEDFLIIDYELNTTLYLANGETLGIIAEPVFLFKDSRAWAIAKLIL